MSGQLLYNNCTKGSGLFFHFCFMHRIYKLQDKLVENLPTPIYGYLSWKWSNDFGNFVQGKSMMVHILRIYIKSIRSLMLWLQPITATCTSLMSNILDFNICEIITRYNGSTVLYICGYVLLYLDEYTDTVSGPYKMFTVLVVTRIF